MPTLAQQLLEAPKTSRIMEGVSQGKLEILAKQTGWKPEKVAAAIEAADPTPNGQYAQWIINQIKKGHLRLPEDGPKSKETLTSYARLVDGNANIDRNITSFKTFPDLWSAVDALAPSFRSRKEVEKDLASSGIKKILEGETDIFEITTPQAATKACRGTNWCVKDPKFSVRYLTQGPLYLFMQPGEDGKKERVALAHIDRGTIEIRDPSDRTVGAAIKKKLLALLASVMGPEVAYRHLDIAIDRAIILGEKLPKKLEDTKAMLRSSKRDEYFQTVYKRPQAMYNRISAEWWMTDNKSAVEYSLAKGVDLPDTVKHRLLISSDALPMEWATAAQQKGIIKFWPELEAKLIADSSTVDGDVRLLNRWAYSHIKDYNPSTAALAELIANAEAYEARSEQRKDQDVEKLASGDERASSAAAYFKKITSTGTSPAVLWENDEWRVVEVSPFLPDMDPLELRDHYGYLAGKRDSSASGADYSDYDAILSAPLGKWYNISKKLRAKAKGAFLNNRTGVDRIQCKVGMYGRYAGVESLELVDYILTYKGDPAQRRKGARAVAGLLVTVEFTENGVKPSLRLLFNDKAEVTPTEYPRYCQPILKAIEMEASFPTAQELAREALSYYEPGARLSGADKERQYANSGIIPVRDVESAMAVASLGKEKCLDRMDEAEFEAEPNYLGIRLTPEQALRIYEASYSRWPEDWLDREMNFFENGIIKKNHYSVRLHLDANGIPRGKVSVALGLRATIPFMRAFLEADEAGKSLMRDAAVYTWLAYNSHYDNIDRKPVVHGRNGDASPELLGRMYSRWEGGQQMLQAFTEEVKHHLTEEEQLALKYDKMVDSDMADEEAMTLHMLSATQRMPKGLEELAKARVYGTGTGEEGAADNDSAPPSSEDSAIRHAYGIYSARFLGGSPKVVRDAAKFPDLALGKWEPPDTTPIVTVESFCNMIEGFGLAQRLLEASGAPNNSDIDQWKTYDWDSQITQTDEGSFFTDSEMSPVVCTAYAVHIRARMGERAHIYGYFAEDNPTSRISQVADGHDFVVIDGRWLVDPWASYVEGLLDTQEETVIDLQDPSMQEIVQSLYGDRSKWERNLPVEEYADKLAKRRNA